MEKQIVYDRWIVIDTSEGLTAIPQDYVGKQSVFTADDVKDYIQGTFYSAELVDGYGARLSMPGYLDCTEWVVFNSYDDATQYLHFIYGA